MITAAPPSHGGRVLPTLNEDGTRRWIRPKPSHGAWWERRRIVAYGLMLLFFAIPHLRLGGLPVFLMDLPKRQFILMGYTFLPTDTLLFMFAMGSLVIGIFLTTAFFGRAWCGWACPQTVYLEFLFRPIGRWFDGGYTGSRNLDKKGLFFVPRRVAKYITFFLLSLFVSHTLLAFFVGTENLYHWVLNPPADHPTAFFLVTLFTGLVWFNFTYFREQTCLIVCPYGRWQAALIDRQSVIVAYDVTRGEPRALGTGPDRPSDAGDCISCGACVQTCPTGIDIRNGLQMECVHCTQCIDACDDVMTRIGKPKGLIRYSSQDAMAGKPRKLIRVRTVLYPVVLAGLLGGLVYSLVTKDTADITLLRGPDAPFTKEADGRISNMVRVKIANRGHHDAQYQITVAGLEKAGLQNSEVTVIAPENPVLISGETTRSTSLFILIPRRAFSHGERDILFTITDGHSSTQQIPYRLLGPDDRSGK